MTLRTVALDLLIFAAAMLLVTILVNWMRARPLLERDDIVFTAIVALVIAVGRYVIHGRKPA